MGCRLNKISPPKDSPCELAIGHVGFKPRCAPGQERIGVDADQPGKARILALAQSLWGRRVTPDKGD